MACALCGRLLQPDHFKSPSYASGNWLQTYSLLCLRTWVDDSYTLLNVQQITVGSQYKYHGNRQHVMTLQPTRSHVNSNVL